MGITNIHRPSQLTTRSAYEFADQAMIQPLQQPVLVVTGPFSQADVDKYEWCLRSTQLDSWILRNHQTGKCSFVDADSGIRVPQIRVGPGLADKEEQHQRKYILVIQGNSGNSRAKVVIEDSLEKAATTMLHAALNGYSTVFSAAFHGSSPSTIYNGHIGGKFRKVKSLREPAEDSSESPFADLLC
nr:hypothetical protein CFP56_63481 [Quercus suber]